MPAALAGDALVTMSRFPIRLKILLAVMALLTTSVAAITASMARAFAQDKIAYVNDVAAIIAGSAAAESAAVLRSYLQTMEEVGAILADSGTSQQQLAAGVLARQPDVVSVSLATGALAPATFYDQEAVAALGLEPDDLVQRALAQVANQAPVDAAALRVGTLQLPDAGLLLVLAQPLPGAQNTPLRLVVICIRSQRIAAALERGRGFHGALVDAAGKLLVAGHGGSEAARGWIKVMFQLGAPTQAGVVTREFDSDGTTYLAARAPVRVAGITAISAIPRTAAYLTARELLDGLLVVSVALIMAGALVALLIARRLTKPLENLAVAAEGIGQGRFDIRIQAHSDDEIGALAGAFNAMAAGLHERDKALGDAQRALLQSEKMSAIGQLSAGLAHEVKNPLAGILGFAQLSRRKLDDSEALSTNLGVIEREALRCIEIIGSLMRFSRQEPTQFEATDINDVARRAVAIVDHQLSLSKVRIDTEFEHGSVRINGNGNQLQQVLMNLMLNAQQAMQPKGGTVRLRTWLAGDAVMISVKDDGPGIAREHLSRVFEPFFTTKPAGQGTGLGLSVTYGIIHDHGGDIAVSSEIGQGAEFTIRLPARASDVGAAEAGIMSQAA